MNQVLIKSTAITKWDAEEQCYVCKSPATPNIIGVGNTPEKAERVFLDILEIELEEYSKGTHSLYM